MSLIKEIKYFLSVYMGRSPLGFSILSRFIYERSRRLQTVVSNRTDICIEGYPRCANTFAWLAFRNAQKEKLVIAHHSHRAGQIIGAVRRGIPVILLIREPESAAISLLIRNPSLSPSKCLHLYLNFYEPVLAYLDKLVVAPFDVVTNDYGSIIEKVNERYSTNFVVYKNSKQNDEIIFRDISNLPANENELSESRPNEAKKGKREKVRAGLDTKENQRRLKKCKQVYERVMARN